MTSTSPGILCIVWIPTVLPRVGSEVRVVERKANGGVVLGVYVPAHGTLPGRSVLVELECVAACELMGAMRGESIP